MFIIFPRLRLRVSVFAVPTFLLMLWLEGFEPFFVIIISALFHELGHIFAMCSLGYRLRRVDVLPMGALIVCPEGIPNQDETKIALAGPLASLLLAFASSLWLVQTKSALSLLATLINLVFGVFNLLPVKKLDGGKALFCLLADKTKRAEKICSLVSNMSVLLFFLVGVIFIMLSNFNLGVIILTVSLLAQLT